MMTRYSICVFIILLLLYFQLAKLRPFWNKKIDKLTPTIVDIRRMVRINSYKLFQQQLARGQFIKNKGRDEGTFLLYQYMRIENLLLLNKTCQNLQLYSMMNKIMVFMIKPRFVTGQSTMVFMDDPLTNLPAFHMV